MMTADGFGLMAHGSRSTTVAKRCIDNRSERIIPIEMKTRATLRTRSLGSTWYDQSPTRKKIRGASLGFMSRVRMRSALGDTFNAWTGGGPSANYSLSGCRGKR